MNLLKVQNQLRSVPDDALINYVQNPQPTVPSYLALSELQRRQEMREKAQTAQPESSVAEDVVGKEQQGGLAAMMGGMQAPQAQPEMPQQAPQPQMMAQAPMPQEAPVMMAEGGLASLPVDDDLYPEEFAGGGMVAFAGGGDVPGYAKGAYIPPVNYDPASQYREMRQYFTDEELRKKYTPSASDLIPGMEYPRASKFATENVVTPYDEAINYYKEAQINPVEKMKAVSTLEERRRAWILGQKDPYTKEPPVGSKYNIAGVPTSPKVEEPTKPAVQPLPSVKPAGPVISPSVDVAAQKPLFPEQPSKSIGDYAKELQDFLGPNTARTSQEDRLQKMESEVARQRDIAPWMALTEAGLATAAGQSPFALSNLGAGAMMGLKSYGAAEKQYMTQLEKLNSLRNEIAMADRREQLAIGEFGAKSKEAYEERVAKEKLFDKEASLREKLTKMEIAGREKIEAMREQGDWGRAVLSASAKGAEKAPSLGEKLKLEDYVDRLMPEKEQAILDTLGSKAKIPGTRNYNEYLTRMEEERNKIRARVSGMGVSSPTLVYDPKTKTIR